tara:strand:+ start:332 stop:487 length:156 start_codon:yes stop_codon:yes gene_type:complete
MDRIGATELSPGVLNQIPTINANEMLKTKIFINLVSNNFVKRNEIKKDSKK